ncbi:CLUMA_CG013890, isoform A [Clunio marinus]|uniref:CLUMA_CG013890, isoform A n=1 Tax=Clunio marinus TaxID=568069 RepID=A0A1J1INF9_9DIPT|nr:CLUMA_CG013890, isoform A [Clunio marinus]
MAVKLSDIIQIFRIQKLPACFWIAFYDCCHKSKMVLGTSINKLPNLKKKRFVSFFESFENFEISQTVKEELRDKCIET